MVDLQVKFVDLMQKAEILSPEDRRVLGSIPEQGAVPTFRIASDLLALPHRVDESIARLVQEGLVERVPHSELQPRDRYLAEDDPGETAVKLSPDGEAIQAVIRAGRVG